MKKIYDSRHQQKTIYNWKKYGLICREGESYQDIYSFVMSVDNCNVCSVKFNNENHSQRKTMDHDHNTGYFRQVLCMRCNKGCDLSLQKNKTGHKWISPRIDKKKNGKICVLFYYQRHGFKKKCSTSLTKLIAISFIHLLKKPI